MITRAFDAQKRQPKTEMLTADLSIVGGGMSGVCAALTAAREGMKVVLVQDRPVLGGNASSEVRLWILGATSHMGNNNRWAREGGIIDEILVENLYRNKEGNPLIFDSILLEKVREEENIMLLLNTQVHDLEKDGDTRIKSIRAFCSQNSTEYHIGSPFFCDASGDGIIAFMAGAPFRMGAEKPEEFGEGFAPDIEDYGELLGHSIYFYTKDTGKPVKFVAPEFALKDAGELPRLRNYKLQDHGCSLWWVEYGGRLDTVHQSEEIKWELWKVIYGIWDYVKNSGKFPEAETMTLEWVGTVPGKRESRRFEGDYMLNQADVVEQREHPDLVAFGGWSLDLHPADGVYSEKMGCNQWHSKGVYGIPYRCYYSRSIQNLFLAGRIISASHVAFGSSRVMATCSHGAQAVGMAAVLCKEKNLLPAQLYNQNHVPELQQRLNLMGQSVPGVPLHWKGDLVQSANIEASSQLSLGQIPFDGPWMSLEKGTAQMLPMPKGKIPSFTVQLKAEVETDVVCALKISGKPKNFSPEETVTWRRFRLKIGEQLLEVPFEGSLEQAQYAFLTFLPCKHVEIRGSRQRVTGLLSVFNIGNKSVSNNGKQQPPEGLGIDTFEFWIPKRRPEGQNVAMKISPALDIYSPANIVNGFVRPYIGSNAWVADPNDPEPTLKLTWDVPQTIREIRLFFDPDYDHPMESSLMGHPEDVIPFCVRHYQLTDENGNVLIEKNDNHQTINTLTLNKPLVTRSLALKAWHPSKEVPAGLFGVVII